MKNEVYWLYNGHTVIFMCSVFTNKYYYTINNINTNILKCKTDENTGYTKLHPGGIVMKAKGNGCVYLQEVRCEDRLNQ